MFSLFVAKMLAMGFVYGLYERFWIYATCVLGSIVLIVVDFGIYGVLLILVLYAVCVVLSFFSKGPIEELAEKVSSLPTGSYSLSYRGSEWIAFEIYAPKASQLSRLFEIGILTTLSFFVATYLWLRYDPAILVGAHGTLGSVGFFVLDVFLRGGFFNVMEHFDLELGKLKINDRLSWYSWFAFSYRLYIPIFLLATILRAAALLRESRSHIASVTE